MWQHCACAVSPARVHSHCNLICCQQCWLEALACLRASGDSRSSDRKRACAFTSTCVLLATWFVVSNAGHETVMPVMTNLNWVSFEQSGCNQSTCAYVCLSAQAVAWLPSRQYTHSCMHLRSSVHEMVKIWHAWDRARTVLCVYSRCTLTPIACEVWVCSHTSCTSADYVEYQRPAVIWRPKHVSNASCKIALSIVFQGPKINILTMRAHRAFSWRVIHPSMPVLMLYTKVRCAGCRFIHHSI